jgi:hypothetical protein
MASFTQRKKSVMRYFFKTETKTTNKTLSPYYYSSSKIQLMCSELPMMTISSFKQRRVTTRENNV